MDVAVRSGGDPAQRDDAFPAISDYGVIGNLETTAHVATNGAIELFSYPHFDSPTIFAAMLDRERGGHFSLRPDFAGEGTQRYIERTNVLVTRFEGNGGVVEVTDFMPTGEAARANQLVRIATCVEGSATVVATCRPAFDYGRARTRAAIDERGAARFVSPDFDWPIRLVADAPLEADGDAVSARVALSAGERVVFNCVCDNASSDLLSDGAVDDALRATIDYWRGWLGQSSYDGRWREAMERSALALKLMFSATHGSIVAAPTFGLPEAIGGVRNWDYRYCWVRDSAFTVYAMLRLGFTEEAKSYRDWIGERLKACGDGSLQLMYRLDGGTDGLEERTLDHLSGYRGSRPVRVGNAAFKQTQLDIYGEVIDTLYLSRHAFGGVENADWEALHSVIDYVCRNWQRPGSGFWEMRGEPQHFLDARLLSWVALDRAVRLAERSDHDVPERWVETRAAIGASIDDEFWNDEIGAYAQVRGGATVDAVALLMPLLKFKPTTDERFVSTMRVIGERLVEGCLVRRYEPPANGIEGVDGPAEGYFVTCSFWWIECLARSSRVEEARALFETLLAKRSPLGLLAEEIDAEGAHLGNTPQALSHLSMVSAATALDRALDNGGEPF